MFTGIIQSVGVLKRVLPNESNRAFYISHSLPSPIKVDESISHNGICLTVEELLADSYRCTAINETLEKTNAGLWKEGDFINLEQSMKMNASIDGHIVQGHVDGTATCVHKEDRKGSIEFTFSFQESFAPLIIEKGAVCVNGVSLTAFNVSRNHFTVAIIPFTLLHTTFQYLMKGSKVNIEYDVLGKYVNRIMALK